MEKFFKNKPKHKAIIKTFLPLSLSFSLVRWLQNKNAIVRGENKKKKRHVSGGLCAVQGRNENFYAERNRSIMQFFIKRRTFFILSIMFPPQHHFCCLSLPLHKLFLLYFRNFFLFLPQRRRGGEGGQRIIILQWQLLWIFRRALRVQWWGSLKNCIKIPKNF